MGTSFELVIFVMPTTNVFSSQGESHLTSHTILVCVGEPIHMCLLREAIIRSGLEFGSFRNDHPLPPNK